MLLRLRQAAAANGDKHIISRSVQLLHNFHPDRAVARDDLRFIERVNKGHAILITSFDRFSISIVEGIACQNDLDTAPPKRFTCFTF